MTTIVGIQGDTFAVVCADSRITEFDGSIATQAMRLKDVGYKVAQNGKWLLGVAGDLRAINILHHSFNPPTPPANLKGKKLDEFFTTKFIPALRACFDIEGYSNPITDNSEHSAEHNSCVMAVINATIYVVEGDYAWLSESFGVYAIGSGGQFALGSLATAMPTNGKVGLGRAKQMALKAISVAGKYDPGTAAPFQVFVQTMTETPVGKKKSKSKATKKR